MNLISKRRVFTLLDQVAHKTKKMVHNIEALSEMLKDWQDGKVKDSLMIARLTRYIDDLEPG